MVLAAVPLGVYAATQQGRVGDYLAMLVPARHRDPVLLGRAAPDPPLRGAARLGAGGRLRRLGGGRLARAPLAAPAGLRARVVQAAILTRTTRAAVLEVLREDYVRTARAKGVGERVVTWKHVLRNALITIVTVVGLQLGQLMAGSIVLETVFYLPGLGRLAPRRDQRAGPAGRAGRGAVRRRPTIVLINFVVDLLYGGPRPADPLE